MLHGVSTVTMNLSRFFKLDKSSLIDSFVDAAEDYPKSRCMLALNKDLYFRFSD